MSEYIHVEKPFLEQLAAMGWTAIDQGVGVIPKILKVIQENGSPAPEFESDDNRTHFLIRLPVHTRAMGQAEVGDQVGTKFRDQVLSPLIEAGLIEMTIPDKPQSSKQKYRLTAAGRALLEQHARSQDGTDV